MRRKHIAVREETNEKEGRKKRSKEKRKWRGKWKRMKGKGKERRWER